MLGLISTTHLLGVQALLQTICVQQKTGGSMELLEAVCTRHGLGATCNQKKSKKMEQACEHEQRLSITAVTKRRNSGNRCNGASNSRKPQKAHSKTESRPTSADQQHRTEAHEHGPKQPATARGTQHAPERQKQSNTQHPTALSATE